jgi:hypothetical protein
MALVPERRGRAAPDRASRDHYDGVVPAVLGWQDRGAGSID